MTRFYLCFWIAVLLVSCDKPQGAGDSRSTRDSEPRVTRADRSRSPRDEATNQAKQIRASLAAAKKIEFSAARDKALAETAWNSIGIDPNIIAKAIEQISTDSAEKIPLIELYALQLAEQNPDEALAWAAKLGSEQEIATAKEQIILALADSDPQRAATLIPSPGAAGRELDGTALHILQSLTAKTPAAAAAWVSRFPPGDARKVALKALVTDWTQIDSQAAFAWLTSLAHQPIQDEATQAIIETFAEQTPEIREQWLQQADPAIRSELERQPDPSEEPADPSIRAEIEDGIAEIVRQAEPAEPPAEPDSPPDPGQAPEPAPQP